MKNKTTKCFALITGASDGFGKSLALECAQRKHNLILVALPGAELYHLAGFITRNFSVEVVCIEADLSKLDDCVKVYDQISQQHLQINILINNAGIGGTHFFEEKDVIDYHRQIQLNVTAPTVLTRLFLDNLKANAPSHVLNVSSLASFFYLPKKQVYAGTKSYLLAFSRSLRRELRRSNIRVSVLCPGGMNTTPALTISNKTGTWLSQWSIMNPEQVASFAIDEMMGNKEVIIPGKWNRLFLAFDRLLPKILKEKLIDLQMKSYSAKVAFQFASGTNSFNTK